MLYQLGVFISRSSVNLVEIHKLWVLPILQGFNFVLFLAHVLHPFVPNIWIMFVLVVYEGFRSLTTQTHASYVVCHKVCLVVAPT